MLRVLSSIFKSSSNHIPPYFTGTAYINKVKKATGPARRWQQRLVHIQHFWAVLAADNYLVDPV